MQVDADATTTTAAASPLSVESVVPSWSSAKFAEHIQHVVPFVALDVAAIKAVLRQQLDVLREKHKGRFVDVCC